MLAGSRLIHDALVIGTTATRRVHSFTVNSLMDRDHVTWQCGGRCLLDGAERGIVRSGIGVASIG